MSGMSNRPSGGLTGLIEMFKENKKVRYGVIGGALALLLIIIIVICVSCAKKDNNDEGLSTENEVVEGTFEETDNEALVQLMTTYYKAVETGDSVTVQTVKPDISEEEKIKIETRAQNIEYIDNIKVYSRPGAKENEYIVFVYYEVKFMGIETKAPGFITTYASTNADGTLYIDSTIDEATLAYVEQVAAEPAIVAYVEQVTAQYTNALASDENLKNYMDNDMSQNTEQAVNAEQQAADQAASAETGAQTPTATPVNETVTATTKVNVRASDSENADRIGQVEAGTTLTRYETRDNGWSKVDFDGQEGYIKSEFLQAEASNEAPAETPAETPEATAPEQTEETTTETTEPEQTETAQTSGKVRVKEAVRVRGSASTDGDVLGSVYEGETFDLIMEQADGWCKITYNGQTGYIKSEFVEISQ